MSKTASPISDESLLLKFIEGDREEFGKKGVSGLSALSRVLEMAAGLGLRSERVLQMLYECEFARKELVAALHSSLLGSFLGMKTMDVEEFVKAQEPVYRMESLSVRARHFRVTWRPYDRRLSSRETTVHITWRRHDGRQDVVMTDQGLTFMVFDHPGHIVVVRRRSEDWPVSDRDKYVPPPEYRPWLDIRAYVGVLKGQVIDVI